MQHIRLLDLGTVSPLRSQTVYHAVAYAFTNESPNTIILVSPDRPYVCIGYHQDLEKEVDLAACRERNLPVYRREVGGGTVYLDGDQVFAQWIFHEADLPVSLEDRYAAYVRPLVQTYQRLGVEAYYRPVNDIHVSGKKIGGTGAARIGAAEVLVGSIMFDFDKATMAQVIRVSSEKMRDKIYESLEAYMTTLREQAPNLPDGETVKSLYVEETGRALGAAIVQGKWSAAEEAAAVELDARFLSTEWLNRKGALRHAGVKISEGVRVVESAHKAPGGLIRVTARIAEGRIDSIELAGDFTLLPSSAVQALERRLTGCLVQADVVTQRIDALFAELEVDAPGLAPADLAAAIMAATDGD